MSVTPHGEVEVGPLVGSDRKYLPPPTSRVWFRLFVLIIRKEKGKKCCGAWRFSRKSGCPELGSPHLLPAKTHVRELRPKPIEKGGA